MYINIHMHIYICIYVCIHTYEYYIIRMQHNTTYYATIYYNTI